MARLRNPRQERFARLVAVGAEPAVAYQQAGYTAKGRARVTALSQRPAVAARIAELGRAWDAEGDDGESERPWECRPGRDWVIARLVETAERALQAVPVTDRKGQPTGEFSYQGSVALRALELLGRELGMFSDRKEPPEGGVAALSDEDLERRAVRLARALGLGRMDDGRRRDPVAEAPAPTPDGPARTRVDPAETGAGDGQGRSTPVVTRPFGVTRT